MKSKYRSHGTFSNERKAQKKLDSLIVLHGEYADGDKGEIQRFFIKKRTWMGKDKSRYQVSELIRKGSK
jgi:hypothetical protein